MKRYAVKSFFTILQKCEDKKPRKGLRGWRLRGLSCVFVCLAYERAQSAMDISKRQKNNFYVVLGASLWFPFDIPWFLRRLSFRKL